MNRSALRRSQVVCQTIVVTALLFGVGAPAAVARTVRPFASPTPTPEPGLPPTPPAASRGYHIAKQLGWLLDGATVMLALAAVILVAMLWRRARAVARPSVPA